MLNQRLHDCFPLLAEGGETVGRDADAAVGGTTTLRGREGGRKDRGSSEDESWGGGWGACVE